jgi:hypothetical protein
MAATAACANSALLLGTPPTPQAWRRTLRPSLFGDVVVVVFLLAQCLDGVFTYVGVMSFGLGIEANPVIVSLIGTLGHAAALTLAKTTAAALGICLHLHRMHGAVAVLAAFYVVVAIIPWLMILSA